ncbi:major facilitator superfamily protein [Pseudohyphozyma bogoriensis]|nr:major facilitator superfamily protein [Pseudohyphozyma bogoriensis]
MGLLSRLPTASSLFHSSPSTDWSPSDPLPSGYSSHTCSYSLLVDETTSVFLKSVDGAKGTVLLTVDDGGAPAGEGAALPGYAEKEVLGEGARGQSEVAVVVEARGNNDRIVKELAVEVVQRPGEAGLILAPTNKGLSVHITIKIPPRPLAALDLNLTKFRIISTPSLSLLALHALLLSTTDAPISLPPITKAHTVTINNENRLVGDKVALKNFHPLLDAQVECVGPLTVQCANGEVLGSFVSSGGATSVVTTNSPLSGTFGGQSLNVSTSGSPLTGTFTAATTLEVLNRFGKIEGTFKGDRIKLETNSERVEGRFEVGEELKITTSYGRVDAQIAFSPALSTPTVSDGTSLPLLSPTDSTTSLPSYSSASTANKAVNVEITTSDAAVEVVFAEQPKGVVLKSRAVTSSGSRISVTHGGGFSGVVSATTSISATAHITSEKDNIEYTKQKRNEVSALVRGGGGNGLSEVVTGATHSDGTGSAETMLNNVPTGLAAAAGSTALPLPVEEKSATEEPELENMDGGGTPKDFGIFPVPRRMRYDPLNPPGFGWGLNVFFAVSTATMAANLFWAQPILIVLADNFDVPYTEVVNIPTVLQGCYAAGLIFLAPLGDLVRRRQMLLILFTTSAVLSLVLALVKTIKAFEAVSAIQGFLCISGQVLMPMAADLAPPERRATAIAIVISGVLLGMLSGRLLSGLITQGGSVSDVYYMAFGLQLLIAVGIYNLIHDYPPKNRGLGYLNILNTMVKLIISEPLLIQGCIISAFATAAFNCFWVTQTFLLGEVYGFNELQIGLFALIGIFGVCTAPLVGRFTDRQHGWTVTALGLMLLLCIQAIFTAAAGKNIAAVVVVILGLDVGQQMQQVGITSRIMKISPESRARISSLYIFSTFLGQLIGTAVGSRVYLKWGYHASGGLCMAFIAVGMIVLVARGPHTPLRTWVGWSGGGNLRKMEADPHATTGKDEAEEKGEV